MIFRLVTSIKGVTFVRVLSFQLAFLNMFSMCVRVCQIQFVIKMHPKYILHVKLLIVLPEIWIFVSSGVLKSKWHFP